MNKSHSNKLIKCLCKSLNDDGTFYICETDDDDDYHHSSSMIDIRDVKRNILYVSRFYHSFNLETLHDISAHELKIYVERIEKEDEKDEYLDGYKKLQLLITIAIDDFMGRNLLTEKKYGHKRIINFREKK